MVILAVVLSTLLFADLTNLLVWVALGITVAYSALGFLDDYQK